LLTAETVTDVVAYSDRTNHDDAKSDDSGDAVLDVLDSMDRLDTIQDAANAILVVEHESAKMRKQKLYLDEVYTSFMAVLEHIPEPQWNSPLIAWCYQQSILFAIEKNMASGATTAQLTSSATCVRLYVQSWRWNTGASQQTQGLCEPYQTKL
jgi:hypothetical protein